MFVFLSTPGTSDVFLSNKVFDTGALGHFLNCMIYRVLFVILNSTELVCPSHKYDIQNSSAYYRELHSLFTMDNEFPIFFIVPDL